MKKICYEYRCANCGGPVGKYKACGELLGKRNADGFQMRAGLHGWQCATCGKGAVVKRSLKWLETN